MIRRTILRYMVFCQALCYRNISSAVKRRLPTMDHIVTAGIITADELKAIDAVDSAHLKYWVPVSWILQLLKRARDRGMIESEYIYVDLVEVGPCQTMAY